MPVNKAGPTETRPPVVQIPALLRSQPRPGGAGCAVRRPRPVMRSPDRTNGSNPAVGPGQSPSSATAPLKQVLARADGLHESHAVRFRLENANPNATATGLGELSATANYFIGNDPAQWRTDVPLYSRVRVDGVYPGVGLVYYADGSAQLEYDFLLDPDAQLRTRSPSASRAWTGGRGRGRKPDAAVGRRGDPRARPLHLPGCERGSKAGPAAAID